MNGTFDPTGVLIVIGFFAAMMLVFNWIVAVHPEDVALKYRAAVNTTRRQCILVPVGPSAVSAQALDLACRLAVDESADILLASVIVVPWRLALYTPLPDREDKLRGALNAATARVRSHRLGCESQIVQDRSTTRGLVRLARDTHANKLVLEAGTVRQSWLDWITILNLLRRPPCEIVVVESAPGGRWVHAG